MTPENKQQLDKLDTELTQLETLAENRNIDVRPWESHDDPLSLEHWKLVKQRIALLHPTRDSAKKTRKKKTQSDPSRKINARASGSAPDATLNLT